MKLIAPLAALGLLFSGAAAADQAAYIEKAKAEQAMALLENVDVVHVFCEPCNDDYSKVLIVNSLEIVDVDYEGLWQVEVNGDGLDLAYTYFQEGSQWRNVALALDMEVDFVSEYVHENVLNGLAEDTP